MDEASLRPILDEAELSYWLKPWGLPALPPNPNNEMDGLAPGIGFPVMPIGIAIGDILVIHRIAASRIIFVAQVLGAPYPTPIEVMAQDPNEKPFRIDVEFLTLEFSTHWYDLNLNTFQLADEFNDLNPQANVNVQGIRFGNHINIPEAFGHFLLAQIMAL